MTNTNPITALTCPSCGGKLQISNKINRFACGYCGNEQIVHRESGIVYLEPIAENVRHIRTSVEGMRGGVDKTAAELAIVRLTKELNTLDDKLKATIAREPSNWQSMGYLEGSALIGSIVMLIIAASNKHPLTWTVFFVFAIAFVYLLMKRSSVANGLKRAAIDDIKADIAETQKELQRNHRLV